MVINYVNITKWKQLNWTILEQFDHYEAILKKCILHNKFDITEFQTANSDESFYFRTNFECHEANHVFLGLVHSVLTNYKTFTNRK